MSKPFRTVGLIGLAVIAVSLSLLFVFPKEAGTLPAGFTTPILAFEFVQTPQEAQALFDSPSIDQQTLLTAMNRGNRFDYIYLILYPLFLLTFSLKAAQLTGRKMLYAPAALAVLMSIADALENVQLLRIANKLGGGDFSAELSALHLFTWLKWGSIATTFLLLAIGYFWQGKLFSKVIALGGVITFALAIGAFLNRSALNEYFAQSVAVMFVLLIVYSFLFKSAENG